MQRDNVQIRDDDSSVQNRNPSRSAFTGAVLYVAVLLLAACNHPPPPLPRGGPRADWPQYGGDPGGSRYSPLNQITRENVGQLTVAWTYRTGDLPDGSDRTPGKRTAGPGTFEATPILVDDTLYLCTPFNRVIALDPESGAQRWSYDPHVDLSIRYANQLVCRGVSTWLDAERHSEAPCRRRILMATNDARLIALDGASGIPCADFGGGGVVSLVQGVG